MNQSVKDDVIISHHQIINLFKAFSLNETELQYLLKSIRDNDCSYIDLYKWPCTEFIKVTNIEGKSILLPIHLHNKEDKRNYALQCLYCYGDKPYVHEVSYLTINLDENNNLTLSNTLTSRTCYDFYKIDLINQDGNLINITDIKKRYL